MRIGLLAGAVGLAIGLPAVAKESKIDFREFNADGTPVRPEFPFVEGRPGQSGSILDLSGQFGSVTRGATGVTDGALSTAFSDFEQLAVLPAELVNQLDPLVWGGAAAGVTGLAHFSAATAPLVIPQYGVVTETIAGNSTKKLRGFVNPPAFGPDVFFGRWVRYNYFKTNGATPGTGVRYVFRPDAGQNCRQIHDTYVTAITSLWTSEPTYVSSGFIIGRLLWGGQNNTTGIGLPIGAIPDFFTLGPDPAAFTTGLFVPCLFPPGHPMAGQNVPVPIGQWFRIAHETDTTGNLIHKIDFNMGGPATEVTIYNALGIQVGRIDRIAFAGAYEVDNDACYIDNLSTEGVEFVLPVPPTLECAGGQFVDNFEWMFDGPIAGQSTVVFDALSAKAFVANVGAPNNKVVRRNNFFNDDRYRRENGRTLPLTIASGVGPFRICMEVSIPSSQFAPNATVQTLAPASVTDGDFVSRLFIGRYTPVAPPYNSRLYVQIDANYNPIDQENTVDPYTAQGTPPQGGTPAIGTEVVDLGITWVFNAFRNVCFDVDQNRNMTISINGTNIHTGTSFVNSIDRYDWECENNQPGAGNQVSYDNVILTCSVLPPVTLPPFTLVYNDDLEWAPTNVTIGLNDDDGNSTTPFRWSSAANMPVVSLNTDVVSNWLKMENLFRDTAAAAPNVPFTPGPPAAGFQSFTQASTGLPKVTASSTRGWTARADMRLTDGTTSRTWSVAQATIAATQFARVTGLTFSSVTGTFWAQVLAPTMADPFATSWVDSGTGLSAFSTGFNQNYNLSISRSTGAKLTFRINGKLLRFTGGPNNGNAVVVDPLASLANGTHKDMDRLFYLASDEDTAPVGSILYTDNIRAWSLPCLGDTNNDGVVNFTDLNNVLGFFGQSGVDITGNVGPDANNDGVPDDNAVNFTDLNLVLSGFGVPCTATN